MDADRISLEDIAKKYGTLKVQHGYMPIYERFFEPLRDEKISLLEIGVHEGASLRTWAEYFVNGDILGVDKVITEKALHGLTEAKYSLINCDASKDFHLLDGERYDIIIDDGSHIQSEVLNSFHSLWDSLKPGGYYIVEDLFAAYDIVWNPDGPKFIYSIQHILKAILIGGADIQEVHWFGRNDINGIVFLRKRYEEFRIQPLSEFQ